MCSPVAPPPQAGSVRSVLILGLLGVTITGLMKIADCLRPSWKRPILCTTARCSERNGEPLARGGEQPPQKLKGATVCMMIIVTLTLNLSLAQHGR